MAAFLLFFSILSNNKNEKAIIGIIVYIIFLFSGFVVKWSWTVNQKQKSIATSYVKMVLQKQSPTKEYRYGSEPV